MRSRQDSSGFYPSNFDSDAENAFGLEGRKRSQPPHSNTNPQVVETIQAGIEPVTNGGKVLSVKGIAPSSHSFAGEGNPALIPTS